MADVEATESPFLTKSLFKQLRGLPSVSTAKLSIHLLLVSIQMIIETSPIVQGSGLVEPHLGY